MKKSGQEEVLDVSGNERVGNLRFVECVCSWDEAEGTSQSECDQFMDFKKMDFFLLAVCLADPLRAVNADRLLLARRSLSRSLSVSGPEFLSLGSPVSKRVLSAVGLSCVFLAGGLAAPQPPSLGP
ncbi:uncharacterized protein AAES06_012825 isoform 1-T1 [Glossophaga mutica]